MTPDTSLWSFILHASFVVKAVLIILLCASIASWTIIFQRSKIIKQRRLSAKEFIKRFWSGVDLNQLYSQLDRNKESLKGLSHIFYAGFREYHRLQKQPGITPEAVIKGTERAMRIADANESESLEKHLSFLATVGSTSPYVGLFGTVWGIMTAFQALGGVQQATIAMVAPGISEALIATAIGLFAAIPAVVAYNRFNNSLSTLMNQYQTFQEELVSVLQHKIY